AYLALPEILKPFGYLAHTGGAGTQDLRAAFVSPWNDLDYLFHPNTFVTRESFPSLWWVNPAIQVGAGLGLALLSALLLPQSKELGRALGLRPLLEKVDSLLARLMPAGAGRKKVEGERTGPTGNPIYWKETTVN